MELLSRVLQGHRWKKKNVWSSVKLELALFDWFDTSHLISVIEPNWKQGHYSKRFIEVFIFWQFFSLMCGNGNLGKGTIMFFSVSEWKTFLFLQNAGKEQEEAIFTRNLWALNRIKVGQLSRWFSRHFVWNWPFRHSCRLQPVGEKWERKFLHLAEQSFFSESANNNSGGKSVKKRDLDFLQRI